MQINSKYSYLGIGSGLDLENIVSSLVKLESKPVENLKTQRTQVSSQLSLFEQLKTRLTSLGTSTSKIASGGKLAAQTVTNSNSSVVSFNKGSSSGSFAIRVNKVATNHTVAGREFDNARNDLNLSGKIGINGKAIQIDADYSLTEIRDTINAADAGVKAAIVSSGGKYSLQLRSTESGASSRISFNRDEEHVARSLGLVTGGDEIYGEAPAGTPVNTYRTDDADSVKLGDIFASTTTFKVYANGSKISEFGRNNSLQELANSVGGGRILGATVSVDFGAGRVNMGPTFDWTALGAEITKATGKETTLEGSSLDLKMRSFTGTTIVGQDPPVIGYEALTIANEVVAAQDAQFTVNGVSHTSSKNRIDNAINGATFSILAAGDADLTISTNTSGAASMLSDLASAFNSVVGLINENSSFDAKSFKSGQFFGDNRVSELQTRMRQTLESSAASAGIKSLSEVGLSFGSDGSVQIDNAKLEAALRKDPLAVEKFFSDSSTGVAAKLNSVVQGMTTFGTGAMDSYKKSIESNLALLDSDIASAEQRVSNKEALLRSRFKAMDAAVSKANAQQSHLRNFMSQFSSKTSGSTDLFSSML